MSYSIRGFEPTIGIEIHVQLNTKSKIFSADGTSFQSGDNENISPVTLGMPGTLPVINSEVIRMAIKTGLALKCQINSPSIFARKNYFYPDLTKGYQISQYEKPICEHGFMEIQTNGKVKKINIIRAHLEEDAGKSTHHGDYTLLNYNRAGIPLLEIVSGPELDSPQEAAEYCRQVRQVVRYLEVCDGNLEEGSLRCDCNVSVKPIGSKTLGTRVELKNINSFRFIEKAIEFEIDRQIDLIERNEKISQETRLYDSDKNRTYSMRTKEDAQDYRYFPDPDLLPVFIESKWIENERSQLPELPQEKKQRFIQKMGLPEIDASVLTEEKALSDYFESATHFHTNFKTIANWILTELLRALKESNETVKSSKVTPKQLAELVALIDNKTISGKMAKSVFQDIWQTGKNPDEIVKQKGLTQISDSGAIEKIIDEIIQKNEKSVTEYRNGKEKLFGFFVGQVMKASMGQASPDAVNEMLKKKLNGE